MVHCAQCEALTCMSVMCSQVVQLLKRHANLRAVDEDGLDPLQIAVKAANADIVTL